MNFNELIHFNEIFISQVILDVKKLRFLLPSQVTCFYQGEFGSLQRISVCGWEVEILVVAGTILVASSRLEGNDVAQSTS